MSDRKILRGYVYYDCPEAVNNKYYMPMPLAAPEKGYETITVCYELPPELPRKRKAKKSILL